jgi:hypothetical protein
MSELKVNKISPRSGTDVTLGDSADTITIPSGATLDASNATLTLPDSSVSLAKLTATGTKDATTFLRGDNTFATPTDNGKVLQVVSTSTTSAVVTTSTSFVDIGLELSITPSSASNKIFLIYTGVNETNGANKYCELQMLRDATQLAVQRGVSFSAGYYAPNSISKLDSPNTTSAITYKMQGNAGDGTVCVFNVAGYLGTLTAFEIAG